MSTEAGAIGGGEYIPAGGEAQGPIARVFGEIRFDLRLRSMRATSAGSRIKSPCAISSAASSERIRAAASGSRKLAVPTAIAVAPGGQEGRRVGARLDPAHADHRDRDAPAATRRTWSSAIGRDRRAREAAAAGAEPRLERRRVRRGRLQRVDQRDGVRAALAARPRNRRRVGAVRRQLDDQRLRSVSGAQAPRRAPASRRAARPRSART